MNSEEISKAIYDRLVTSSLEKYSNLLETDDHRTVGRSEREFLDSLDQNQRVNLFKLIRQSKIDTVASLFSFLDGSFWIEGQKSDLILSQENEPEVKLNVDLADTFLRLSEDDS